MGGEGAKHTCSHMNFFCPGCHPATQTTARGFEPLRAEPNGFLVHHLSHSVTLSWHQATWRTDEAFEGERDKFTNGALWTAWVLAAGWPPLGLAALASARRAGRRRLGSWGGQFECSLCPFRRRVSLLLVSVLLPSSLPAVAGCWLLAPLGGGVEAWLTC